MKKLLTFLLFFIYCWSGLFAHNPTDSVLLGKYWDYRQRFLNRFVRIGDQPGFSMPNEQFVYGDCRQDWIWGDYPPLLLKDGDGILKPGGDQTCSLGHYIALLATEYSLLDQNHQPLDSVSRELYYAIKSYFRLEREANEIFHNPTYFGYFLRQDAPNDLNLSFRDDSVPAGKKPSCTFSEEVEREYSPDSLITNFTSQDQVVHLMYGMAMVKRCVPASAQYNGEGILALATEAARRMIYRFYKDAWDLNNPHGQSVGNARGGQAQPWAYAFDKTWAYINPQGKTFGDYTYDLRDAILKNLYDCCAELGGVGHFYNKRLFISLASTANTKTIAYNFDYTMTDGLWIYPLTQGVLYNQKLDNAREIRLLDTMYEALTQAPAGGPCINMNNANPDCNSPRGWRGQNRWLESIDTRDTITDINNHPADHYGLDYMLAYNLYRLYTNPVGYYNTHQTFVTAINSSSKNNFDINIYPNPATNEFTINYYLPTAKNISIELFDITGRTVKQNKINEISAYGNHREKMDISDLPASTYILRIKFDEETFREKLIKY